MNELPYLHDPEQLKLELRRLIVLRESGKQPRPREAALNRTQRLIVVCMVTPVRECNYIGCGSSASPRVNASVNRSSP